MLNILFVLFACLTTPTGPDPMGFASHVLAGEPVTNERFIGYERCADPENDCDFAGLVIEARGVRLVTGP